MNSYLTDRVAALHRHEGGQIAFMVLLAIPVVLAFFALGLDAGVWFFDHRTAQNQADAAALAAVQHLPAADTTQADAAANTWLTANGWSPLTQVTCGTTGALLVYSDRYPSIGDGLWDTVRACVRRPSQAIFATLSGISSVYVSAAATATVGPASSPVLPWGIVPPDVYCGFVATRQCKDDVQVNPPPAEQLNGDLTASDTNVRVSPDVSIFSVGKTIRIDSEHMIITAKPDSTHVTVTRAADGTTPVGHANNSPVYRMQECGDFGACPWGLDLNRLYTFKEGGGGAITPGNFGAITACGQGTPNYKACINNEMVSGFFLEGATVNVGASTGATGGNTNDALNQRYATEGADGVYECDVEATPHAATSLDPDGKALANAMFTQSGCNYRLVAVPILQRFPSGSSEDIWVLGVATFGIAKWDRQAPWGNPIGWDLGATKKACNTPNPGNEPGLTCGMVWGYLDKDWRLPAFLLQRIDPGSQNPLAPLLIAMIE